MTNTPEQKATDVILEMTKQIVTLCTSLLAAGVAFAKFAPEVEFNTKLLESAVICLFVSILAALFTFMTTISALVDSSSPTGIIVAKNNWVRIPGAIMVLSFIAVVICLGFLLLNLI